MCLLVLILLATVSYKNCRFLWEQCFKVTFKINTSSKYMVKTLQGMRKCGGFLGFEDTHRQSSLLAAAGLFTAELMSHQVLLQ